MKRSKLFLGITFCLLGIAAFAASKFKTIIGANYKDGSNICHSYGNTGVFSTPVNPGAVATLLGTVIVAGQNFQYPLYTANLGVLCLHPLYQGGE